MRFLNSALTGQGETALDSAALDLASLEFPGLVREPYLARLDDMAAELADTTTELSGAAFVAAANTFLFDDLGFRGNEADYYDPRNSCLNWVLDQRSGIPITLSLIYIELARRIGRPVFGIGLPGHFVIKYDDGSFSTYLDPYSGGKLLNEADCRELVESIAGADALADPNLFLPVGARYILVRMLNNLRIAYLRREDFARVINVLDVLIGTFPATAEYYRDRAIAKVRLRRFRAGGEDFEQYLALQPQASDRDEIVKQLAAIHRWLGTLN